MKIFLVIYNRKITTFTNVLSEVYNNENDLINYFDTLQDDVNEDEELQEKIKAIVNAIYRKNIENFVDFKYLKEVFNGYND